MSVLLPSVISSLLFLGFLPSTTFCLETRNEFGWQNPLWILTPKLHSKTRRITVLYLNRDIHSVVGNVSFYATDSNKTRFTAWIGKGHGFVQELQKESESESVESYKGFMDCCASGTSSSHLQDFMLHILSQRLSVSSLYTPFLSTVQDTRFLVHFPSVSQRPTTFQYIIIARGQRDDSINKVKVHFPSKRLSISYRKYDKSRLYSPLIVNVSSANELLTYSDSWRILLHPTHEVETINCLQGDLSGTKIESLLPVTVVVGMNDVAALSDAMLSDADDMQDQIVPVSSLSKKYFIPLPTIDNFPLSSKALTVTVSVMSGDEKTVIHDCSQNITKLNPYTVTEWTISKDNGCVLRADRPVSVVALYSMKQSLGTTDILVGTALTTVTWDTHWFSGYILTIPHDTNYYGVILVAYRDDFHNILLNESIIKTVWNQIQDNEMYTSYLPLNVGNHRLRVKTPNSRFGAYVMSGTDHSLSITPAAVRRPLPITLSLKGTEWSCDNTVTYDPRTYGFADHIDNDCDGLVDEELCFGQFSNNDEDLDGLIDEDCAGWADTSYMEYCVSDDDCTLYGQQFSCQQNHCTCRSDLPSLLQGSDGWWYDQLDGLCWPSRESGGLAGMPLGEKSNECGLSFFLRDYFGYLSCICLTLVNPWNNHMSCHKMLNDSYCVHYDNLCSKDTVCLGTDMDFTCMKPSKCYGERIKQCPRGTSCVLDNNEPVCMDITDDCKEGLGDFVCPKGTRCQDANAAFQCVHGDFDPCTSGDSLCLEDYNCRTLYGASYECIADRGFPYQCTENVCTKDHICIPLLNGYLCQAYILCSQQPYSVENNCTDTELCISLDNGYMCVPDAFAVKLPAKDQMKSTMGGYAALSMLPLLMLAIKIAQTMKKSKDASTEISERSRGYEVTKRHLAIKIKEPKKPSLIVKRTQVIEKPPAAEDLSKPTRSNIRKAGYTKNDSPRSSRSNSTKSEGEEFYDSHDWS